MRPEVIPGVATPGRRARRRLAAAVVLIGALSTARAAAAGEAADPIGAFARSWVGTWATALTPASPFDTGRSRSDFEDESIRMLAQTSIGGDRVRIRLSNAYGEHDLTIGHATVGRPTTPSTPDLDPRSVRLLLFHGSTEVVIPAGGEVLSDPVPIAVAPLGQLAVTIYLPDPTGPMTWHWIASAVPLARL